MTLLFQDRGRAETAADRLKAFAQPQRLMILSLLLAKGEQSVSEIDISTGIGQPALSQQLAELRRAALVSTRRQSKKVYYSLSDESASRWIRNMEAALDPSNVRSDALQSDVSVTPARSNITMGAASFVRILFPN